MQQHKGDFIGGLDHSPCLDGIFDADWSDEKHEYGPFAAEADFNEGIVQALRNRASKHMRATNPDSAHYNREFVLGPTVRGLQGHDVVFSHGDLHDANILVRCDGTVVLLDWGLAGYWPAYWEFYQATFNPPWRQSWEREIERFVPAYYVENMVIQKVFSVLWA
jgi:serine/threonine protein kinase